MWPPITVTVLPFIDNSATNWVWCESTSNEGPRRGLTTQGWDHSGDQTSSCGISAVLWSWCQNLWEAEDEPAQTWALPFPARGADLLSWLWMGTSSLFLPLPVRWGRAWKAGDGTSQIPHHWLHSFENYMQVNYEEKHGYFKWHMHSAIQLKRLFN